ncbi:metabotropic glutamate receptor 3-like [Ptychodera flava]|uniref:metabotropic glutamate receptor 3-like n=1 Tax=Ptychodera flava TaxID=63121 RepID=UPI003969FDF1
MLSTTAKELLCNGYLYLLVIYHLSTMSTANHYPNLAGVKYSMPGDLIIGGLFPLHDYSDQRQCTSLRDLGTLLRVESMVYAIEEINNNTDILPNITIGFEIYDTCTREATSLAQILRFLPVETFASTDTCECVTGTGTCTNGSISDVRIDAVIGTEMSFTTIPAAQLLGLAHIFQISYYATSDDLSSKDRFPYFLRLSPPDKLQVQTMIDLMEFFDWSFVSLVHSDDNYGKNGQKELKAEAEAAGICIAESLEVSAFMTADDYDDIVQTLLRSPKARVLVMFVQVKEANGVLYAIDRANASDHFILIGSDGWAASIDEIEHANRRVAAGVLKINLYSANFQIFEDYFRTLNPSNNAKNPWFDEFWDAYLGCSDETGVVCSEAYGPGFSGDNSVSLVIDSVYTFALGWEQMRRDLCTSRDAQCEQLIASQNKSFLMEYMLNLKFEGASGPIAFDENGDLMGKYDIHTIQLVGGDYQLVKVGIWDSLGGDNKLNFTDNIAHWYERFPDGQVWPSFCSVPCAPGEITIPREHVCCWDCVPCRSNEITTQNATKCTECEPHMWPDEDSTKCEPIPPSYIQYGDPWAIMLATLAALGLAFSSLTLAAFIHYNNTPLVKATSRELSYIMFIGISLSYLLVYCFLAKPTTATCYINRLGFMVSFTFTYSPLITKTNRIYRIFDAGKKSTKRPPFISPRSQVIISMLLVFLQLLISISWLIYIPPEAILIVPIPKEKNVELSCNITENEVITSLCYNVLLVVMCSYYAFKARKVPSNYNETRFISVSVYTTLVIWLAFIPTYFTTNKSYFKVTFLSLAMIMNATVSLVCMYMPKIYAVHFLKEVDINAVTQYAAEGVPSGSYPTRSRFGNRLSNSVAPSSTGHPTDAPSTLQLQTNAKSQFASQLERDTSAAVKT